MNLKLNGLTKQFDGKMVVDNISFEIMEGELVTLLGPSGCGKTTILKMIGGFLTPSSGTILLDGIEITKTPPEKRPVTTVFQNYALFPHMTVLENVMYGLRYKPDYNKNKGREKALEILSLVNMSELSNRNVTKLSGGQQQRVALARALILNPKVLLLDEPLSNLDAKLRIRIRREIKEIQKKLGMTMLFVTHDQEEALSLSDRIFVINEGKIEQIGTPKEIYMHPHNQFVAQFIGRGNIMRHKGQTDIVRPENIIPVENEADYRGIIVEKQYMGSYTTYFLGVGEEIMQMDVGILNDEDWDIGHVLGIRVLV